MKPHSPIVSLFLCLASSALLAQQPTKILFIGHQPDHPYGSHMYLHTAKVLAACVELTEGVETHISDGWPTDPKVLEKVNTIVVYTSPAAELLLGGPDREQVEQVMARGCGLVTIHWASTVRQENLERLGPPWMKLLGGTWISNVGLSIDQTELRQLDSTHPVCRGWKGYQLRDEFYLNPQIGPEAKPLLEVTTKDQKVVVGWAFERPDGGRSYATTLGHYYDNFQRDDFRKAIVNAILWTAKRDVPPDGAPIDLSADALKLPPK